MKLHRFRLCAVLFLSVGSSIFGGSVIEQFFGTGEKKFVSTIAEERQEKHDELVAKIEEIQKEASTYLEESKGTIAEIKSAISLVKQQLVSDPNDEFLNKKLSLFNTWYVTVKESQSAYQQLQQVVQEHIEVLKEYLADSDLVVFKRELGLDDKVAYSFEDLQNLAQRINELEKTKKLLLNQEKNARLELENRKQAISAAEASQKRKQEEQRAELVDEVDAKAKAFDLTRDQKSELLGLESKLYASRQKLDRVQLREIEQKAELIKTKLILVRLKGEILNRAFSQVKASIHIREADISKASDELKKKQQVLNTKKQDQYDPQLELLQDELADKRRGLEAVSKRLNIPLGNDLSDWSRLPKKTVDGYLALAEVGRVNDYLLLLERKKDFITAHIAVEEQELYYEKVKIDIQETFYKKDAGKFSSEDNKRQEINRYIALEAEIKANISRFASKKTAAQNLLAMQKKALENIRVRRTEVAQVRDTLFRNNRLEYRRYLELLNEAEDFVLQQIDLLTKTISKYQDVVDTLNKAVSQVEFIISELKAIQEYWDRPEHAISWEGVKNIIPDVMRFGTDIRSYLVQINPKAVLGNIKNLLSRPLDIINFIFQSFVLLAIFALLKMLLPIFTGALESLIGRGGFFTFISSLLVVLLKFLTYYFYVMAFWLFIFLLLMLYPVGNQYVYILFYLFSIPYLLFLANRFIIFFVKENEARDYIFLSKEMQARVIKLMSTLFYATIAILFFRQAFILADYPKSELPTILLAVNFIIFQISVIFLLSKEQILSVIPQTKEYWVWLRNQVNNYYYLILLVMIAIIVMINPYVGFGKLVLYLLSNLINTILLVAFLLWLHGAVKRTSSHLFFQTQADIVKERFSGAKTWYGIFIIAILLSFIFFGAIISSKIWRWPEALTQISGFSDLIEWLQTPLLLKQTDSPISAYTFLHLLFFILMGLLVAYGIRRFVLNRIFDVLLVDAGVQNTVSSIMRYLVMLAAVILGFQSVGLGAQINWIIGALILGIGWVVKDPISDFFSYFIILVQRPVKIGDFIQIDPQVTGVVRKITPRSVVLRRKNSTMVVIPNSYLMNKPITNWNYVRGFIAFNDIIVTIDYEEDPKAVRDIFYEILQDNQYVLKNPQPVIRLDNFNEYGYMFMIRGYLNSNYTLDQWNIASDIRIQIVEVLRKRKVKLALPIRLMRVSYETDPSRPQGPDIPYEGPPIRE